MSEPSVNLKDVAAAAQEFVAQLKRDAESAADRIKRQGEESARAVTNALAQLEEGLGEMSELMLAASHVFVKTFDHGAGCSVPFRAVIEANCQQAELAYSHDSLRGEAGIRPGKHKAILIIIPEGK